MDKFRLDWNYHSSKIEGNALTYGETKALLLFGITSNSKPLKDHLEIKGHDEAIKLVEEIIKQERPLTENFIRELHLLILKEPYENDAITPEGNPTKKLIKVGEYKKTPNHVKTVTGEIFRFAEPEETPAKMYDLLEFYNTHRVNSETNFVWLASVFHYEFIRIHPFDDGNGRIARILMNFILMQNGYPPVIIKTEQREEYITALRKADVGDLESFVIYVGAQLIHSLELMIRGAKGEKIDEPEDLKKKIDLLKTKIKNLNTEEEISLERSAKTTLDLFHSSFKPLFESIYTQVKEFSELYTSTAIIMFSDGNGSGQTFEQEIDYMEQMINTGRATSSLTFKIDFKGFKKAVVSPINDFVEIRINLEEFHYSATAALPSASFTAFRKLYHQKLDKAEILEFVNKVGEGLLNQVEKNIERLNPKD